MTREESQAAPLITLLQRNGADCVSVPLLQFEPLFQQLEQRCEEQLPPFDWLFFTSANTVRFFHEWVQSETYSVTNKIGSVGKKTTNELLRLGYDIDFEPSVYSGETMAKEFLQRYQQQSVALVCGESAREDIPKILTAADIYFKKIVIYRTIKKKVSKQRLIQSVSGVDAVFFTSPSTVEAFKQSLPDWMFRKLATQLTAVAIGHTTANVLEEQQFSKIIYPETYTIEDMVYVYIQYLRKGDR
ncbi:uroporphyrinogen-III synthase [Gracilibacillus phocaeensis]|uniref:uroporphyrinogen-III synthase n=1 Tax=Gracilibacillus phocaeensis TaxID=2042304 RepID=UPI0013EF5907|nr:uroporphyrinogen-III synthase [Gracilibacillus phocaeensis]